MPRNPTVLIIDENQPFRQELQGMLASARLAVVGDCGYGVEAVTMTEELKPDLILAAVEDPIVRAVQTIRAVREVSSAPVIAYSSNTELSVVRQIMHAGAKDLLAQPLKTGEVLAAIELVMKGVEPDEGPAAASSVSKRKNGSAGTVVTVFGAKGGIGKTTITTNVAVSIAKNTNHSVLIMDLDTRFGDVAIMLDIEPRVTVADVCTRASTLDRESLREALVEHSSGVWVLPSPKHPSEWRAVKVDDLKQVVAVAARMFDYVILDTPGAFNDIVGAALDVANQVVVVTSVDMASIKDTAFILDVLDSESFPEERLLLTVNHPNGANTIRAADIERVLRKKVYWEIPHDSETTLASQVGQPVVLAKPRSKAATNLAGLAAKITGTAQPKKEAKSLFRRLIPAGSQG